MSYNNTNRKRWLKYVLDVYKKEKQEHIPDTYLVRNVFPNYGIFISYRVWLDIKGLKPSEVG